MMKEITVTETPRLSLSILVLIVPFLEGLRLETFLNKTESLGLPNLPQNFLETKKKKTRIYSSLISIIRKGGNSLR